LQILCFFAFICYTEIGFSFFVLAVDRIVGLLLAFLLEQPDRFLNRAVLVDNCIAFRIVALN